MKGDQIEEGGSYYARGEVSGIITAGLAPPTQCIRHYHVALTGESSAKPIALLAVLK